MQNTLPTLQCPNLRCRTINTDQNQFCQKCGTYLPKRFLWVIGARAAGFQVGDILEDRFLFRGPRVVFDTQPGLPLKMDVELPETLVPYLKLFPYRLHIPQIYTLISLESAEPSLILLLEQAPLSPADMDPTAQAGALMGAGMPLFEAWSQTPALRQLHWLWQSAQLWQPLRIQGVASSLLQPELLRVEGPLLRFLELENDFRLEPSLTDLGQVWQQLIPKTEGKLADSLDTLCGQLASGEISAPEELLGQLERWIENIHKSYRVKIDIATRTDTGMVREHNEDACYPADGAVTQNSLERMAIVCDGVGGHAGGEVASGIAIEALRDHLTQLLIDDLSAAQVITELENASLKANDLIAQRNDQEQRQDRQRMGTTLVTALSQAHQIYISHIGDSRAYLITTQGCYQIMVDDDIASREVRLGYVPYREALLQPASGSLVQALGMASSSILRPTVQRFLLDEDCLFLLCSDGLSDYDRVEMLWREELLPLLQGGTDLASASKRLIELANQWNGHDNVTVGLVHCHVIRQRQGSGSTSLFESSSVATNSAVEHSLTPVLSSGTIEEARRQNSTTPKRGGLFGIVLLLGLLLLGIGGAVAYKLGSLKLPLSSTEVTTPASLPPELDTPVVPPAPDVSQVQKMDVLRLVGENKQSIEIAVVQDPKELLGQDKPLIEEPSGNPTPNPNPVKLGSRTLTVPNDGLIVVDGLYPAISTPGQSGVVPIRIQTCRAAIGHNTTQPRPQGAGSPKPKSGDNPLQPDETESLASPVAQQTDQKLDLVPSSTAAADLQIGWVARSQLQPLVAEIIPLSQLTVDQKAACTSSPLEGKDIPAGAAIDSEQTP